jgi:hypothetical protein
MVQSDQPAAAADLTIYFQPADANPVQVLELMGFEPGTFFSGAAAQIFGVGTQTPGRAEISVQRLPTEDRITQGAHPLLTLLFRSRRTGEARLEFDPSSRFFYSENCSDPEGCEVPGLSFSASTLVAVDASAGGPPGQRISFAPELLQFDAVAAGQSSRRRLRITNLGFSELHLYTVATTLAEFSTYFPSCEMPDEACMTVPSYGSFVLPIEFSPSGSGIYAADVVVHSNDATRSPLHIPLRGRSGRSLSVQPDRLEFGTVAPGAERSRSLRIANRGSGPLVLAQMETSGPNFDAQAGFEALEAGEVGSVAVTFSPAVEGELRGSLAMTMQGAEGGTIVVRLVGAGG